MSQKKGTNSIFVLAFRTRRGIRWSWGNFSAPIIVSLALATMTTVIEGYVTSYSEILMQMVGVALSFNASVFGIVLSGFAIYASLQNKEMTVFSASNAPDDSNFSFLKIKLLTFFKGFFWLFICCTLMMCALFLLNLYKYGLGNYISTLIQDRSVRIWIASFLIFWLQCKVFIEFKIFIFNVYNNTLTQARFMCQEEKIAPFDESNY